MKSKMPIKRRKLKVNRTSTVLNDNIFFISSYRSSWKFIDKNTVQVCFQLDQSLLKSIVAKHFIVRHIRSDTIESYNGSQEIINSTLTLYLHAIKHGRHTACLLIYTKKIIKHPKHIFCQDIIFNFRKYGHYDIDSDESGNTFVFLLTQYAIVIAMLCTLQLVHFVHKRRLLRTVYKKAGYLRNLLTEYNRRLPLNKSTSDLTNRPQTLEYLIYNLNRDALRNFDRKYMEPRNTNDDDDDHENNNNDDDDDDNGDNMNALYNSSLSNNEKRYSQKYLRIPNFSDDHSTTDFLDNSRTISNLDLDEEILDADDLDVSPRHEQTDSYKSLSHILEENKPWITTVTDNGNLKHSILSKSKHMQTNRLNSL